MRTVTALILVLLMASTSFSEDGPTPTPTPEETPTPTPEPTPTPTPEETPTPTPEPTATPEPTETPTPTPEPTATPYVSLPETVVTTSVTQTSPAMVLPVSIGRERATIEVLTGEGVVCSQTDSEVRTDAFRVFESPAPPYQLVDPHAALYCKSRGMATLQIVADKNPDLAYTKVVKNLGASLVVLKRNMRRTRASIIVNNWSGNVYCGYTCPVTNSNGMLMNTITQNIFRDRGEICCTTVEGNSDISITAEFSSAW